MNSFRIHATESVAEQPSPYLLLTFSGQDRVCLDFESLTGSPNNVIIPQVTLTAQALYELLEGKELLLPDEGGSTALRPAGDELVIVRTLSDDSLSQQFRVWTAELCVAWNLLGRS